MMRGDFSTASITELVNLYVEKGLARFAAAADLDTATVNRLIDDTNAIARNLIARGPEANAALLPLLDHANECIRMMAAASCNAIAPERARTVLEDISAHGNPPYRFLADAQLHVLGYPSRIFGRPEDDLSKFSAEALVQRLIEKSLAASAADAVLDNDQANRCHLEAHKTGSELARRGSVAVQQIVPLMDHPDECVRMMAARYANSVTPERSRRVLSQLSAEGGIPYRFLADAQLDELGYESRLSKLRSSSSS